MTATTMCACPDDLATETGANQYGYTVTCSGCGREQWVPHFPDPLPAPRTVASTAMGRRTTR